MAKSVMETPGEYREFYDRLGHEYAESATVYATHLGHVRYRALIRELTPFARRGERLLDVGCNDGVYTVPFCELGGRAHGIDISKALVEKARARAHLAGVSPSFEAEDIEEYRPRAEYDIVLMSEVLEHLRNPEVGVRNAVSAMVPGGHLLLSTPLPYYGFREYLKRLVARQPLTQPFELEKFGVRYRHDGYYPLALKDWLEGFGLECVKLKTLERNLNRRSPMRLVLGDRNLQLHRKVT